MKLFLKVAIICGGAMTFNSLFSQSFEWAKKAGGTGEDAGTHIATDLTGNSYVSGRFQGSITLGNQELNEVNGSSFLVKYDNNGVVQWVKQMKGTGLISMRATEPYVYLAGFFRDSARIGEETFFSKGGTDAFLVRMNAAGAADLVIRGTGAGDEVARSVDVDGSGNMYLTGYFGTAATFGTTNFKGNTDANYFTIKFDVSGSTSWFCIGHQRENSVIGNHLSVSDDGNTVYVMGTAEGSAGAKNDSVDFCGSGYYYRPTGSYGDFVIRYDAKGSIQVIREIANTAKHRMIADMDQDVEGNVYLAESYSFGPYSIIKYNSQLKRIWTVNDPEDTDAAIVDIEVDAAGFIYATGSFSEKGIFSGDTLEALGFQGTFISRYDNSGAFIWVYGVSGSGGSDVNQAAALGKDGQDNIYITGSFNGTANFDTVRLVSDAGDLFVAKLNPDLLSGGISYASENNLVSVFPNPANGSFTIRSEHPEILTLINASGQQVKIIQLNASNNNTCCLSNLASGIYFIIGSEDGKIRGKLVAGK